MKEESGRALNSVRTGFTPETWAAVDAGGVPVVLTVDRRFRSLEYDPSRIRIGAGFGNRACFVRTDPAAGLDNLWQAATCRWYFGRASLTVAPDGEPMRQTAVAFEPGSILARFEGGGLVVRQRLFVPVGDEARAYILAEIENVGADAKTTRVEAHGVFHASPSDDHRRQPLPEDVAGTFVNPIADGRGRLTVTGPAGERLTVTASTGVIPTLDADGAWSWADSIELDAGAATAVWVSVDIDCEHPAREASEALKQVNEQVEEDSSTARVCTPDPIVNAGALWSKVNTRRVCHKYPYGEAFTNDPPGPYVVVRDTSWFCAGADYFMPEFCRNLLDMITKIAPYPNGKIAEYLLMNSSPLVMADYGLNIADPTPLYILAIHHHAAITADREWLQTCYPVVLAAARYIVSQTIDGLVFCDSRSSACGEGVSGWRNVVEGACWRGATAELQSECIAAISAMASMADELGDASVADEMRAEVLSMRAAMLHKLVDTETGRFRFAYDPEAGDGYGKDDTVDQVYPLLFELVDGDIGVRTSAHLVGPEYRTPHGVRTVAKNDPTYHPTVHWGLLGGSWPNASAWVAAGVAPYLPEEAARLATDIVRPLFPEDPSAMGAVAPGQFPEWFHGDEMVSLGMALSPWMPPTYVWLIVERFIGVRPSFDGLKIAPRLPASWEAAFVRSFRYADGRASVLVTHDTIYSTVEPAESDRDWRLCSDVTDEYTNSDEAIVLRSGSAVIAHLSHAAHEPISLPAPIGELKPGELRVVER